MSDKTKKEKKGESEILDQLALRVDTAVGLIRDLRKENAEIRAKLEEAESRLATIGDDSAKLEELVEERETLHSERDEVRARIERILGKLEQLDDTEA